MAATIVCARMLGPTDYGRLSLVVITVTMFALFAVGGLGLTATRAVSLSRDVDRNATGRVIAMADGVFALFTIPCCAAMIIWAPNISELTFGSRSESQLIAYSAIMVAGSAAFTINTAILAGFESFGRTAVAHLVRGTILVGGLVLISHNPSITTTITIYGGSWLVGALFARYCVAAVARKRQVRTSYAFVAAEINALLRFSLPALLAGAAFTPAAWMLGVLLVRHAGPDQMGIFNAANQWQTAMLFFATSLGNLALPMLSNAYGNRDIDSYLAVLRANVVLVTTLTGIAAGVLSLAAPLIIRVYGTGFEEAKHVLYVCALGSILMALATPVGHVLWSLGATTAGLLISILRAVLLVAYGAVFVRYGAIGAAWAYVFMTASQLVVSIPYAARQIRRFHKPVNCQAAPRA